MKHNHWLRHCMIKSIFRMVINFCWLWVPSLEAYNQSPSTSLPFPYMCQTSTWKSENSTSLVRENYHLIRIFHSSKLCQLKPITREIIWSLASVGRFRSTKLTLLRTTRFYSELHLPVELLSLRWQLRAYQLEILSLRMYMNSVTS